MTGDRVEEALVTALRMGMEAGIISWPVAIAVVLLLAFGITLKRAGIILGPDSPLLPTQVAPPWDPEKGTGTVDLKIDNPQDNKPKGWE
jgi:hypothetical protein